MPVWNVNRPATEFEKGCHVIGGLGDKISALPILLPLSLAHISLHEFLCMKMSYIGGDGISLIPPFRVWRVTIPTESLLSHRLLNQHMPAT